MTGRGHEVPTSVAADRCADVSRLARKGAVRRLALLWTAMTGLALSPALPASAQESSRETICRLIEAAAEAQKLPASFLTRLIWRESSFRSSARSGAGAQGIAQFMPATAQARGLSYPFDPEAAIPASAAYLADLRRRFGSLGLAAAAYNAGPARITLWRTKGGVLPEETRRHVLFVTGRDPDDWANAPTAGPTVSTSIGCAATLAAIRVAPPSQDRGEGLETVIGTWGIQLVANANKGEALNAYTVMQQRYAKVLGDQRPTILSTRLGGRGRRTFYRIRIAFDERKPADVLCARLRSAGGSCLTVRN